MINSINNCEICGKYNLNKMQKKINSSVHTTQGKQINNVTHPLPIINIEK